MSFMTGQNDYFGFTWKKRIWARSIRPKFRKFQFKIEWNRKFRFTSRGCPFFLEIWKIRKFPVPFGIYTRYELAPVSLAVKSYKMAASLSSQHYTGWKVICHSSPVLDRRRNRYDLISCRQNMWTGRSGFPGVRSPGLHTLPREKFVSSVLLINIKEELNSDCVLNFSTWSSLIRHLKQPLHRDPSAFFQVILGGK